MTGDILRFAFWGRVSTEDNQDPESSRGWQLTRARSLIEPHRGQVVTEFFDVDKSRSIPPARRPQAAALLTALADPHRGFDAVVVGEPQRAFYGNQFGNTFPIFAHYGVALWVPEVGGPIDPDNEAHDLIMSVFGGVSKGERNRIRIRVRTAMAAQAQLEGRFLGGRPPYGYRLIDAGPHPNPSKAADGRRLHALALDDPAAAAVQRIFAEFIAGRGLYAIAEGLTREGIPSPAAHDPERNRHRSSIAWSKSAIRAILKNPRYTGRQVWNRQRKDEVLIDVNDVALGHTTKMRWNDSSTWVFSDDITHPPVISEETFNQAQARMADQTRGRTSRERVRTRHPYALSGRLLCGVCDRKMQSHWANELAYYRCRFPAEYALANKVSHPRNVFVREDQVLPGLDAWLTQEFAPHRMAQTIEAMADAQDDGVAHQAAVTAARERIRDCDAKMARYRAAIDAGGDITEITSWINATKADRAQAEAALTNVAPPRRMTAEDIRTLVSRFAQLGAVIATADPADKAEIYRELKLTLTYQPAGQTVTAVADLGEIDHGVMGRVRGPSRSLHTCLLSPVSWYSRAPSERGRIEGSGDPDRCVALLALIMGTTSYLPMYMLATLHSSPDGSPGSLRCGGRFDRRRVASTAWLADSRTGRTGGALPWALLVAAASQPGSQALMTQLAWLLEPFQTARVGADWVRRARLKLFMLAARLESYAAAPWRSSWPGVAARL